MRKYFFIFIIGLICYVVNADTDDTRDTAHNVGFYFSKKNEKIVRHDIFCSTNGGSELEIDRFKHKFNVKIIDDNGVSHIYGNFALDVQLAIPPYSTAVIALVCSREGKEYRLTFKTTITKNERKDILIKK